MKPALPEGWATISLPDLSTADKFSIVDGPFGSDLKLSDYVADGTVPVLTTKNLTGVYDPSTVRFISTGKFEQLKRSKVVPGDVLIAKIGSIGKCSLYPRGAPTAIIPANLCKISVDDRIASNSYLLWQIRSDAFQQKLKSITSATAQPAFSVQRLKTLSVDVPPLPEQVRIVETLERIFDRATVIKTHLEKIADLLTRFRQAVLATACSGRLTEDWRERHPETGLESCEAEARARTRRGVPDDVALPDYLADFEMPTSWALKSVASLLQAGVLKDLKDGNHGSNHPKTAEFGDDGLPFITAAQVKDFRIDYEGAPKVTGEPLKRLKVGFSEAGDVVLTHKGTVGRAAINTEPCVLTPQTTYYRTDASRLDPNYLVFLLSSPFFYSQLAAIMSQTTRDFVPISKQYHLFLIVPPAPEQLEIRRRVAALFRAADRVQQAFENAQARVDRLSECILAKAFRGNLVPTEAELARRESRDYEPASVLLERIKRERGMGASNHRKVTQRKRKHAASAAQA